MFCSGPFVIKVLEMITEIPDSLIGIVFICDSDSDGEPKSLSESVCERLLSKVKLRIRNDGKELFSLVYEV